jgi:hypothetical protein
MSNERSKEQGIGRPREPGVEGESTHPASTSALAVAFATRDAYLRGWEDGALGREPREDPSGPYEYGLNDGVNARLEAQGEATRLFLGIGRTHAAIQRERIHREASGEPEASEEES